MISILDRMKPLTLLVALAGWLAAPAYAADVTLTSGQVGSSYTYNITTNPAPPSGTTYMVSGLPAGLSVNSSSGVITGTPTESGSFSGTITLQYPSLNTDSFTYALSIAAALGAPQIDSSLTSALGLVGDEFTLALVASNSPTSFNVGGSMPPGLSYDANTTSIIGTPTVAGTYNVTLSANNSTGTGQQVTLVITILPSGPVPAITSSATATADLNTAFSYQIAADNSPTSYSASGLPVGLSLDTATGLISGTPTVGGVSSATLTASNGNGASANFTLTFILGPVAVVNSSSTLTGYVGAPITPYLLTATNSPLSFNVGALPSGLSYSTGNLLISGTPAAAGNSTVAISANNGVGEGPGFSLSIQIATPVLPAFTTQPASQTKNVGESVTFTVAATGGPAPTFQWKKDGSNLVGETGSNYTISSVTSLSAGNYTVDAINLAGTVSSDVAILTVNANGYAAWKASKFNVDEAGNSAISGNAADPDADGVINLVEYALDLNPKVASTVGLPVFGADSSNWTFTYSRPADRPDITYTVEYSTNLTTWTSTGVTHVRTATGTIETWQGSVPRSTGNNVFFRLKVETLAP